MYPAYFDGEIHEINRNLGSWPTINSCIVYRSGWRIKYRDCGPNQMLYVIILSVAVRDYNINTLKYIYDGFIKTASVYKRRYTSKL